MKTQAKKILKLIISKIRNKQRITHFGQTESPDIIKKILESAEKKRMKENIFFFASDILFVSHHEFGQFRKEKQMRIDTFYMFQMLGWKLTMLKAFDPKNGESRKSALEEQCCFGH